MDAMDYSNATAKQRDDFWKPKIKEYAQGRDIANREVRTRIKKQLVAVAATAAENRRWCEENQIGNLGAAAVGRGRAAKPAGGAAVFFWRLLCTISP